jgi:polyhydroxyalkanoate synthesis regulator phasin
MCDHYDHYYPEHKEQRDENIKKQMEILSKPYQRPYSEALEEIKHLKNRLEFLENSLKNYNLFNK